MTKKHYGFAIPISGVQYTEVLAESEEAARQILADGDYDIHDMEIFEENYEDARLTGIYDEEEG